MIEIAATSGLTWAQSILGYCYQNGYSFEKNVAKAHYLYKIAATKGCCEAQYNLGEYFLSAKGIHANQEKALKWLIKTAQQGHQKASTRLGWDYL